MNHTSNFRVVVLQRVVPHYRRAVFRRAYEELGWIVATGGESGSFGLNLAGGDEPWLFRFPTRQSKKRQYATSFNLRQVLEATKPNAVVAEFSLQMTSTWHLAASAAIGVSRPLAFWSQGQNVERGFDTATSRASQKIRLALMKQAHAQLCYSQEGADYLRKRLPARQGVFVAPNTLDVAELQRRAIDKSPSEGRNANLLLIGRVTEDKRMEVAVEAFVGLRQRMPNAKLLVVGDGPAMPKLQAAIAKAGDGIEALGAIYDQNRLDAIYGQTSLTLIPGSAGLNVNQSLGYGVPVMLFDEAAQVHHHPEHAYVQDGVNGFRVQPATPEALTAKLIEALAESSPRFRLAAGIKKSVDQDLSLSKMIHGMRELHIFLKKQAS